MTVVSMIIPSVMQAIFGNPPVLRGEDLNAYLNLKDWFVAFIKPQSPIEWLWVNDLTNLSWEILRLWRFKVLLIERNRDLMRDHRQQLVDEAAIRAAQDDPDEPYCDTTIKPVPEVALSDSEQDSARLFAAVMEEYQRIDKLIASAEQRRNRTLREIERHRAHLARQLRAAVKELHEDQGAAVRAAA